MRRFILSNRSPPNRHSLETLWSQSSVAGLAVQAGNATGQARNVNAVACGLSSVGTRRGSGRSWRRLGRGGLRVRRARCRSCAACRSYPSAANGNYQGGSTTEQRELGPSLSFHLTSLSRFGPVATIRCIGQHPLMLDASPPNRHSVEVLMLWGHKAPLCRPSHRATP
jgi:hypothetical protein